MHYLEIFLVELHGKPDKTLISNIQSPGRYVNLKPAAHKAGMLTT
jgi:hypothetical protein